MSGQLTGLALPVAFAVMIGASGLALLRTRMLPSWFGWASLALGIALISPLIYTVLPLAFIVVIVGGMGSLKGAAIGSILVGLVDNWGKALFPDFSYFTLFLPMAIVLAIRPSGLFGEKTG